MRGPNRKTIRIARILRMKQTDAERALWRKLRNRQIANCKFVRQEPVGPYVCDFVCRERRLVVEVDGGQHSGSHSDVIRDRALRSKNYRVLRFWNSDVVGNIEGVLQIIEAELLAGQPLTPTLSP